MFSLLGKFSFSEWILIKTEKAAQRFRRLKDFGCAAPDKDLSGDTALPHSEPIFPVISAMLFRYHGVQNLMCSKHIEQSCCFPPITLCNSLICSILTYNSHHLYFSSYSGLQVPFKMILPSAMLLQSQSGDL